MQAQALLGRRVARLSGRAAAAPRRARYANNVCSHGLNAEDNGPGSGDDVVGIGEHGNLSQQLAQGHVRADCMRKIVETRARG